MVSPYSVKGSDGKFPLILHSLAPDEVLCKVVGQLTGFPHEGLVLQVSACYLLVDILQAHEKRPVAKPGPKPDSGSLLCLQQRSLFKHYFENDLPGRICFSHPHEVHVTGQNGEVRRRLGLMRITEVTVGQQNIHYQLQVGLPSNRLPEQNHSCVRKVERLHVISNLSTMKNLSQKQEEFALTFNFRKALYRAGL